MELRIGTLYLKRRTSAFELASERKGVYDMFD